jgi:CHAT domain-containing protein
MSRMRILFAIAGLASILCVPCWAGEGDAVHDVGAGLALTGQLGPAREVTYKVRLSAGKVYVIDMISPDPKALDPFLRLFDATGKKLAEDDDGGEGVNARIIQSADSDGIHRIVAASFGDGRGKFDLTVREEKVHEVGSDGVTIVGKIDKSDPKLFFKVDKSSANLPVKSYLFRLVGGKRYRLALDSDAIDSFLVVRDTAGRHLAWDDDSGGGLNSLLRWEVPKDGLYVVCAASLKGVGPFTLGVHEEAKESAMKTSEPPPAADAAALKALVKRCMDGGGLSLRRPADGAPFHVIADRKKLRAAVAVDREALTPGLREALIKLWDDVPTSGEDAVVEMLFTLGRERKDDRALGYSAFYTGMAAAREGAVEQAILFFRDAARLFETARDPAMVATAKHQAGYTYRQHGEDGKALALYEEVLKLRREIYPKNHKLIATTLNNIGVVYANQGRFDDALRHHGEALAIRRALYGEEPNGETAWSLRNIGYVHHQLGDLRTALKYATDSLEMRLAVHKGPHPEVADMLHTVGGLRNELGDFSGALELLDRAQRMYEALGEPNGPEACGVRFERAQVHRNQGKYREALAEHEEVLALRVKILRGRRDPSIAASHSALGNLHLDMGEYAKALVAHRTALEIDRQFFGEKHDRVASDCNNVAVALRDMGEYVQAIEHHERALSIWRRTHARLPVGAGYCLDNVAVILGRIGKYADAEARQKEALAIFRDVLDKDSVEIAACLNGMGLNYSRWSKLDEAIARFEEALRIVEERAGGSGLRPILMLNLAECRERKEEWERALDLYRRAEEIATKIHGVPHPLLAEIASRRGWIHRERGEFGPSLAAMDKALAALVRPEAQKTPLDRVSEDDLLASPETVTVLAGRGRAIEKLAGDSASELRRAARQYELAATVARQLRQGPIENDTSRLEHIEKTFDIFPRWIGVLERLAALENKAEDREAAFRAAEAGTARLFTEELAQTHAYARKAKTEGFDDKVGQLLARLDRCRQLIAAENAKPLTGRSAERVGALMEERKAWDEKLHELIAGSTDTERRAANFLFPEPSSLAQVRSALADREVLLMFVLGTDASFLILVEESKVAEPGVSVTRLPATGELEEIVDSLTDPATLELTARTKILGRNAYDKLLGPVAARLRDKKLTIVPSGALANLPFELLVRKDDSGKESFLIEEHRIRYLPSASILPLLKAWRKDREAPADGLWVLGDPVYQASDSRLPKNATVSARNSSIKLERLVHSGREAEAIRKLFSDRATLVTGTDATASAVLAASKSGKLAQARYLHFAAHGDLGLGNGRQPSLVLSLFGIGAGDDDGLLRMDDVTNLRLNADLVVLSACKSGQGRLYGGEGVRGLARAFLHAGSMGVVCTLWSIDDGETADLMIDLYGRLRNREDALDSLRAARVAMIRAGKAPLAWAPFVLIGE